MRAVKAAERHVAANTTDMEVEEYRAARWTAAVPAVRRKQPQRASASGGETEVEQRRQERLAFVAETRPEPPRAMRVSAAHDRVAAEQLAKRDAIMDGSRETRKTAMERTMCEGTHVNVDSAWRLWLIFCPIRGIDAATFGRSGSSRKAKVRYKIMLAGVKVRGVQKISLISCARLLVATAPPGTRRALLMAADQAPRRARSMRAHVRARGSEISTA